MDPSVAFAAFANGKDHLDLDDLKCATIAVLGIKMRKADLRVLLQDYTPPGAPGVTARAFEMLCVEQRRQQSPHDRIARLFDALDTEGRGYLDFKSFSENCSRVTSVAAVRAREIFYEMDQSKAGIVTLADFEAYLAGTPEKKKNSL
mmetsp:Transcript_5732/g.7650  ORF Transcript_5732/g.7650 Transcript_5732/m.7650 type:complete len:147 (+) Transcript_5732:106-546(+)